MYFDGVNPLKSLGTIPETVKRVQGLFFFVRFLSPFSSVDSSLRFLFPQRVVSQRSGCQRSRPSRRCHPCAQERTTQINADQVYPSSNHPVVRFVTGNCRSTRCWKRSNVDDREGEETTDGGRV